MRTLLPLIAAAALTGVATGQPAVPPPAVLDPAAPDGPLWYACRVTVDDGDGNVTGGSGTPVYSTGDRTLVLTCAHVVPADRRDARLEVAAGGKTYPARFVGGSGVRFGPDGRIELDGPDLCLLEVTAGLGAVPVAAVVGPGEAVFQAGYGGTRPPDPPVTRRGRVATDGAELALDYRVESGDSGTGVFNAAGELVGVTAGRDPTTQRGYAVPVATIRAFLSQPRMRESFPQLAARLDATRVAGPAAAPPVSAAGGHGLPPTLMINGKAFTRVPGTREYVENATGTGGALSPSSAPR